MEDIIPTGFSRLILGMFELARARKNAIASCSSPLRREPASTGDAQVRAGREGDHHVPGSVTGLGCYESWITPEIHPVENILNILLDVLTQDPGRKQVTTPSVVTAESERLTDDARFFAGDQDS